MPRGFGIFLGLRQGIFFKVASVISNLVFFEVKHHIAPKHPFSIKVVFFQKDQLGIGQSWLKLAEIGQKGILKLYLVKFT